MNLKIKSLTLTAFKGVKEKVYPFGDITRIMAKNGVGKTTIATAWMWLMNDKDYSLKSNPNVKPLDMEECTPRVEAVLDIDGVEVVIAKQQKIKTGKADERGVAKTSSTNTYEINSSPKTERDFRAELEEKGLDLEHFLALSHPNVFTGQKSADMRKILFEMATAKTDLEIASVSEETADVAKLLESYKLDEIEAMNKASRKKAAEQVEAIPNQIIGMEKSKVDIDTAELELAKNALLEEISQTERVLEDNKAALEEYEKQSKGALDLKFAISDIERVAMDEVQKKRKEKEAKINIIDGQIRENQNNLDMAELDIKRFTDAITRNDEVRKKLGDEYNALKDTVFDETKWVFDEKSTVCAMCGREYDAEKVEDIKKVFEENKAKAIAAFEEQKKGQANRLIADGNELKNQIAKWEKDIEEIRAKNNAKELEALKNSRDEAQKEFDVLPTRPDLSSNQDYEAKCLQLKTMEKALETLNSGSEFRDTQKTKLKELQEQLAEINANIAKSSNNVGIDEKIATLQEQQRDYEQAKADAEKILYQISLISKRKNELLVEEINSHFGIVKWQLFDFAKNGEYKEVCTPLIDGKRFGDSTNTGLEIVAKLDIANSLQKFFDMRVPIVLDNAESINEENIPPVDSQILLMIVTKDKELKVEVA